MISGLKAGWRGLRHLQHQGYVYIWANLLWIGLTLLVIPAPAAWMGLIRLSYHAQRSPTADFEEFWNGFRESLKHGALWALALINVVVIVINTGNLIAYRSWYGLEADVTRTIWLLTLLLWFALQFYALPLFYAMEQPSLIGAFRNAAVMILLNPLFTLGLWIVVLPLVVISVLIPPAWILLTGSVLASIANSAVLDRLRAAGIQKAPESAPVPSDEAFYDTF